MKHRIFRSGDAESSQLKYQVEIDIIFRHAGRLKHTDRYITGMCYGRKTNKLLLRPGKQNKTFITRQHYIFKRSDIFIINQRNDILRHNSPDSTGTDCQNTSPLVRRTTYSSVPFCFKRHPLPFRRDNSNLLLSGFIYSRLNILCFSHSGKDRDVFFRRALHRHHNNTWRSG
uniref:Uncharacterized protein n=1 Tax=Enterobacter cloacae TaxID=550 RepID=A0A0K0NPT7_ENTCL|nr:hypothetical protein pKPC2_EC14653_00100 [Enterobacter cloacae]AQZ21229.1 hypothetical protein pKPC2_EClY2402_00100 [Enterobacter cloacae]AQZ21329.1 hypothetical protein pKPC2_EClY2403_00100 [Enterobacter cloacae]